MNDSTYDFRTYKDICFFLKPYKKKIVGINDFIKNLQLDSSVYRQWEILNYNDDKKYFFNTLNIAYFLLKNAVGREENRSSEWYEKQRKEIEKIAGYEHDCRVLAHIGDMNCPIEEYHFITKNFLVDING